MRKYLFFFILCTQSVFLFAQQTATINNKPEKLSSAVNSSYDEVLPVISPDGKTLFFDRKLYPQNTGPDKKDDIWMSKLIQDSIWTLAENLGAPLNNEGYNFLCSISPDGNTALLGNSYSANTISNSVISISNKTENGWSFPVPQNIENFINRDKYNEFCLSASGNILLMAIQTDSSLGMRDIYVSFKKTNNKWTTPINLGKELNTSLTEMSPFLAADGITLYFASNGLPGIGSYDIYMSRRLDETWKHWSKPVNIGPPVNTSGWDAYFSLDANGNYAYFSSSNSSGNLDIYRIKLNDSIKPQQLIKINGFVYDKTDNKKISASIKYIALDSAAINGVSNTTSSSGYLMYVKFGYKYVLNIDADNYFSQQVELDLSGGKNTIGSSQNFYLIPKKEGVIIEMKTIQFKTNSALLMDSSYTELNKILKFLQDNPHISIEVRGHTNGLCEDEYCNALSERRARAVADYFINNGITKERITSKGLGKTQPVADNSTVDGRLKNQRVEFMITKIE